MDQIGRILDDRLRGKAALANADTAGARHLAFKGQRVLAADDSAWKDAGMDDYLTKPFTLDSLASVIGNYLEGEERAGEPAEPVSAISREERPAGAFDKRVLNEIASMQSSETNLPLRALTLFQEHSQDALRTLAASMKEADSAAIAKAAHALKSMSLNVGAKGLADACAAIENAARDEAPQNTIVKLCKVAATEFRSVHRALPATMHEYGYEAA